MKSINLTKEQKEKLLKMCNALFPEYKEIILTKCNTLKFGFERKGSYYTWKFSGIHWFEFCLTHLVVRLSKEFTKQGLSEADYTHNQYPNWFSEKLSYHLNPFRNEETGEDILFIHPLDYLYTEFLKLKK